MATREQCEAALRELAVKLSTVDPDVRRRTAPDRSIACRIPDLGTTFTGHLDGEGLSNITEQMRPHAQIVLTVKSDDLLAITEGRMGFATAWATGRVKVDASMKDLIRLRSLL